MLLFLPNLAMGGSPSDAPPPAPPAAPGRAARGGRAQRRREFLLRYVVELGGETFYFDSEADAEAFLRRQSRKLVKRAQAVARRMHRVTLPAGATAIPLPQSSPIPRFVVHGTDAIAVLSQQINAKIDAVLANPEHEADMDDDDLLRILQ